MEHTQELESTRRVKTWFIMARTHHMVCVAFANALKPLDLTSAQHELLALLLFSSPTGLTQKQLAEQLFVTKGNITGLVKRLEARGLVQREEDAQDRRKNNVTLTPQGRELAERSCEVQQELVDTIFAGFNAEQDQDLRRFMKTLRAGVVDYTSTP